MYQSSTIHQYHPKLVPALINMEDGNHVIFPILGFEDTDFDDSAELASHTFASGYINAITSGNRLPYATPSDNLKELAEKGRAFYEEYGYDDMLEKENIVAGLGEALSDIDMAYGLVKMEMKRYSKKSLEKDITCKSSEEVALRELTEELYDIYARYVAGYALGIVRKEELPG